MIDWSIPENLWVNSVNMPTLSFQPPSFFARDNSIDVSSSSSAVRALICCDLMSLSSVRFLFILKSSLIQILRSLAWFLSSIFLVNFINLLYSLLDSPLKTKYFKPALICSHKTYLVLQNLSSNSTINVISNFGNRTLLVVAHPDDETMFFGPTILNLMKNNKSLSILCLSNGNANQNGVIREKELAKVIGAFGSKVSLNVFKNSKLQDDMSIDWDDDEIIDKIRDEIQKSKDPIRTILTFDYYGVSGHSNHKSINRAVLKMNRKLSDLNINVLALNSVNIFRKYSFFLDSLLTVILNRNSEFTIALNLSEHSLLKEILKLHKSQMVWFRKLYMNFSRYMFLNDLKPIF